ncbi:MAG TPA: 2'-5' RNA ligase family protein, partial [Steroidobacteraceae bacterium]|nr:2'-5' RNA ligase family protein [Steroidobacteraceae bacterium]
PDAAYLRPDPSESFVSMTRTVCAQFPDYPPYRGQYGEIIPHLTVADRSASNADKVAERLK